MGIRDVAFLVRCLIEDEASPVIGEASAAERLYKAGLLTRDPTRTAKPYIYRPTLAGALVVKSMTQLLVLADELHAEGGE